MVELDDSLKQELMDEFHDLYDAIESALTVIVSDPRDELLRGLFRSIHTIKGNAGICGLKDIVNFTHALEEIAESLRSHRYQFSEPIRDCIQLGMDRLHSIHERDLQGIHFDNLKESELITLFREVSVASQDEVDAAANRLIDIISSGINPGKIHDYQDKPVLSAEEVCNQLCLLIDDKKRQSDLFFFQELSMLVDMKFPAWNAKSIQLFDWAHKINEIGGGLVDYEQFSAAIYMHDIGLSYIPNELLLEERELTQEELNLLQMHPILAYNHLDKIPGWEEAAQIVLQHHEHVNGTGYPNGLQGNEIHAGAKILAIVDRFFHLTNGCVSKENRRSVVRAVSDINTGIDSKYEGMWVQCFNHMVRKELREGYI